MSQEAKEVTIVIILVIGVLIAGAELLAGVVHSSDNQVKIVQVGAKK